MQDRKDFEIKNHELISYKGNKSEIELPLDVFYIKKNALYLYDAYYNLKSLTLSKNFQKVSHEDVVYINKKVYKNYYINSYISFKFEGFIVDKENPYFVSKDGFLLSKDYKTMFSMPTVKRDAILEFDDRIETFFVDSIVVNSYIKEVHLPKAMTVFNLRRNESPFYHISNEFNFTIFSPYIKRITHAKKVNLFDLNVLKKARFLFPNFDILTCGSRDIGVRLAVAYMENDILYSDKMKESYNKFIENNFFKVFFHCFDIKAKKALAFIVKHKFMQNLNVYKRLNGFQLTVILEILILQNDFENAKFLASNFSKRICRLRPLCFACRYADTKMVNMLLYNNFVYMPYGLTKEELLNDEKDELKTYHKKLFASLNFFKDSDNLPLKSLHELLIKQDFNFYEIGTLRPFYKDIELQYKKGVKNRAQNLKLLIDKKAIDEITLSHLFYLAFLFNKKDFLSILEGTAILDNDVQAFEKEINSIFHGAFINLNDGEASDYNKLRANLIKFFKYLYEHNKYICLNDNISQYVKNNIDYKDNNITRIAKYSKAFYKENDIIEYLNYCAIRVKDKKKFLFDLVEAKAINLISYLLDNNLLYQDESDKEDFILAINEAISFANSKNEKEFIVLFLNYLKKENAFIKPNLKI